MYPQGTGVSPELLNEAGMTVKDLDAEELEAYYDPGSPVVDEEEEVVVVKTTKHKPVDEVKLGAEVVLLFVAKTTASGVEVLLSECDSADPCSDSGDGPAPSWSALLAQRGPTEDERDAALRALQQGTDLRGPPEVEFVKRLQASDGLVGPSPPCDQPGRCALYVAVVREEVLQLRGMGPVKQALSKRGRHFKRMADLQAELAGPGTGSLAPLLQLSLPPVLHFLEPWAITAGKDPKAGCADDAAKGKGGAPGDSLDWFHHDARDGQ